MHIPKLVLGFPEKVNNHIAFKVRLSYQFYKTSILKTMRNSTLSILSLGLIVLFLGSCSTSSDLNNTSILKKRRYTKGYHVNIKGNNNIKNKNSVRAKMNPVDTKAVIALRQDNMAQATSSGKISEADLTPAKVIPFVNESATTNKADLEMKSLTAKAEVKNSRQSRKHRVSNKDIMTSNLVVPASSAARSGGESLLLYIILGIIIPPLAVGLLYGIGTEFWISLLLTIIGWIPGIIYSLIKVFQKY